MEGTAAEGYALCDTQPQACEVAAGDGQLALATGSRCQSAETVTGERAAVNGHGAIRIGNHEVAKHLSAAPTVGNRQVCV